MKIKSIIATIVILGVIGTGSLYLMNSHTANASTNTTNSNNLVSPNNTINSNNEASTTGNTNTQNTESTKPVNLNNKTTTAKAQNTKESSTQNITNNTNNSSTNQNSQKTKVQTSATPPTTNMIKSTGDFSDIVSGSSYMSASIAGTNIVLPFNNAHIVNNQLVLPEYYTSKLNEVFTAKISSTGNGNFVLYEFYDNKHTATMDLKYHSNQYESYLSGTFKHVGSNAVTGLKFDIITKLNSSVIDYTPFYHCNIAGTPVNITVANPSLNNKWLESYAGNPNTFNLAIDYDLSSTYRIGLLETYNGKKTGEYLLNPNDPNDTFNNTYTGVFITKPNTPQSKSYSVTLTGNYSPN
ncbi:hypothetical protein [uncultured Clostridium sp.]|jgi:hypothetical protein|uniref:hypothetical protein n=1 Tax=uncultured Clostridium sp. TaxID=59620 RepID=UPI002611FBD8|nr:hypothetical protein [uncultured Clostridium sp.]